MSNLTKRVEQNKIGKILSDSIINDKIFFEYKKERYLWLTDILQNHFEKGNFNKFNKIISEKNYLNYLFDRQSYITQDVFKKFNVLIITKVRNLRFLILKRRIIDKLSNKDSVDFIKNPIPNCFII